MKNSEVSEEYVHINWDQRPRVEKKSGQVCARQLDHNGNTPHNWSLGHWSCASHNMPMSWAGPQYYYKEEKDF
jgi:hypothetical protein